MWQTLVREPDDGRGVGLTAVKVKDTRTKAVSAFTADNARYWIKADPADLTAHLPAKTRAAWGQAASF